MTERCCFCKQEIFEEMEALGCGIYTHKNCTDRLDFEHKVRVNDS